MKKSIFVIMLLAGTVALAGQSGLSQYRYTQGNYSFTVVDRAEFDAFGTEYDKELAFMEHRGGADVATGQPGYDAYSYTQKNYSDTIAKGDEFATRMSRGLDMEDKVITGQPGYDAYRYTQQNYSDVMLKD